MNTTEPLLLEAVQHQTTIDRTMRAIQIIGIGGPFLGALLLLPLVFPTTVDGVSSHS